MVKKRSPLAATVLGVLAIGSATVAADELDAVIDWSAWDRMLRAHVVDGSVDYDAIAADPSFPAVVDAIAAADVSDQPRQVQLAFHINAYNVLAVRGILDGSSPRSAFGKLRYFFRDKYLVAGEELSLHAYEHQRILPLGEPRVHFAINCASASCPELRSEAYRPSALDAQLDDAARQFINDPTRNVFHLEDGRARLSKIFKWFRDDFEAAAGDVQRYLAPFVDHPEVAAALRERRLKIRYLPYDWSLNGTFAGR
jgi:hypothetical protein